MPYISHKKVHPTGPLDARILIIGEAPGYDEDREGKPFVGKTGEELTRLLGGIGIDRQECRITNVCNYRPADNNFDYLKDSRELKEGVQEIKEYLSKHKPKVILILGKEALRYVLGKHGITKWRGSVIQKDGHTFIVTYHPAYILNNRSEYPILEFDFKKFRRILDHGYTKPVHDFVIDPRGLELHSAIEEIRSAPRVAIDIETPKSNPYQILCAGFAVSPSRSICIVNHTYQGLAPEFSKAMEKLIDDAPTEQEHVYHNGYTFDVPVFRKLGFKAKNSFDTFIAARALQPEFRRTLAFLASIHTEESFHKDMIKESDDEDTKGWSDKIPKSVLQEYNCIDCIDTFNVCVSQLEDFKDEPECWRTFQQDMALTDTVYHLNTTGLLIDPNRNKQLLNVVETELAKKLQLMQAIAGRYVNPNGKIVLKDILFNQFKLPPRRDGEGKLTTKEEAIVSLIAYCKGEAESKKLPAAKFEWEKRWAFLKLLIRTRGLLKLRSNYINFEISDDGRIKSTYKLGTETGRWSCSKSIDDKGVNAQTMPREILELVET